MAKVTGQPTASAAENRRALGTNEALAAAGQNMAQASGIRADLARTQMQSTGFAADRAANMRIAEMQNRSAMMRDSMKVMNDAIFQALGYGIQSQQLELAKKKQEQDATYQAAMTDYVGEQSRTERATRERQERYDRDYPTGVVTLNEQFRKLRGQQAQNTALMMPLTENDY